MIIIIIKTGFASIKKWAKYYIKTSIKKEFFLVAIFLLLLLLNY